MAAPAKSPLEPLDVDAVRVVLLGTALWSVGFLVLLPFRHRLADAGHEVWLWTCLAGWLLGLAGLPPCYRQRRLARQVRATVLLTTTVSPAPGAPGTAGAPTIGTVGTPPTATTGASVAAPADTTGSSGSAPPPTTTTTSGASVATPAGTGTATPAGSASAAAPVPTSGPVAEQQQGVDE